MAETKDYQSILQAIKLLKDEGLDEAKLEQELARLRSEQETIMQLLEMIRSKNPVATVEVAPIRTLPSKQMALPLTPGKVKMGPTGQRASKPKVFGGLTDLLTEKLLTATELTSTEDLAKAVAGHWRITGTQHPWWKKFLEATKKALWAYCQTNNPYRRFESIKEGGIWYYSIWEPYAKKRAAQEKFQQ